MYLERGEVARGFEVGAIGAGVVLTALLVVLVPTSEFRVRLQFLLGTPDWDLSLHAVLAGAGVVLSTLGLMFARVRLWPGLLGALGANVLSVLLLSLGFWSWLPEFTSPGARTALSAALLVGGGAVIVRLRYRTGWTSRPAV